MKFSGVVEHAIELLRRRERVTYRALKREFDLDDEALVEQGQVREGIAQMRQSQATFLRAQLLAEASGKGGQGEEGLTVLAKALSFVETQGPRIWEAEL